MDAYLFIFRREGVYLLGNIVNALAIGLGAMLGLIFKRFIRISYTKTIMNGLGLSVIVMGLSDALEYQNLLLVIVSVVLGSLIGEALKIEDKLVSFGDKVGRRFEKDGDGGGFSKAFVTTTLIYCVGAMSILGAIESGLKGDHSTLYTKSMLDGISSIIFSSTLGFGVLFSALSTFVYQGIIVLAASGLKEIFTETLITELSAVGGILIIAIGINVLELKKIKVGNMLPSLLGPIIYYLIIK